MRFLQSIVLSLAIASALMTPACTPDGPYFGKTTPPVKQWLRLEILAEPATLDPEISTDLWESYIVYALFEGLTHFHPQTLEPMAALATHYEITPDQTRYIFYLRGHPNPRGIRLPNTDTLRRDYLEGKLKEDFSRGHSAPPDDRAARWSDGSSITAHDFVYSWRRAVAPATAATYAYLLHYIKNAEAINKGKLEPEQLAVRAVDDFTLQVDLRSPTPFFLRMTSDRVFCPVPRQAIEAARQRGSESSWTGPGYIVTSGAFTLRERRRYDKVVLAKNPCYYEAGLVALEEITFLPIVDGATMANLYKAGEADAMWAELPQLIPLLQRKNDFRTYPAFSTVFPVMNTRKPPFDNVLVRYALNMATDKNAITTFLGAARSAALNLVPSSAGYEAPQRLRLSIGGKSYDVLSFDPEGARELLAKAGFPNGVDRDGRRLTIECLYPVLPDSKLTAQILQQQWQRNLNIAVSLVFQELQVWLQTLFNMEYKGVAGYGDFGAYVDPNWFLDQFMTGAASNCTGWTDPKYDAMVTEANATIDPVARMSKLSACERYLLSAMPFLPLYSETWRSLQKPYVRGVGSNLLDRRPFKYVWIDTNWRPEGEREQISRK